MRISCPSCQSSYKIADEKVQGRTVKVRCRKCGLTIQVNEQGVMPTDIEAVRSVANTHEDASEQEQGSAQFSVLVAEGDQRDMTMAEVVTAYSSGVITNDTYVWAEGLADWTVISQVPSIVQALNETSDAVAKDVKDVSAPLGNDERAAFQPETGQAALGQTLNDPEQAIQDPSQAGASQALFGQSTSTGSSGSLFGAGAAIQQPHQQKPDLFGISARASSDDDVATSAPRIAPVASRSREESSMMFSLSALTAAATSSANSSHLTKDEKDDSGLIDLRALADQDRRSSEPTAAPHISGGILDAAPLLGTAVIDPNLQQLADPEPPSKKKNTLLIAAIVMGGLGMVSLAVALVLIFTKEEPPPLPPPQPVAVQTAEPAPTATQAPADTASVAAAPATGTAATPDAEPPKKHRSGRGKSAGSRTKPGTTSGGSTSSASSPAATSPTPKKPPPNKCNCPPGDLACNIRCSVKGK